MTALLLLACARTVPATASTHIISTPAAQVEPVAAPLAPVRLEAFLARARETRTTALIVVADGQVVASEGSVDAPHIAMSVSKSVTALVIGHLVDQGHLVLDEPLSQRILPEWSDEAHAGITLRHLLTHLSGLPNERWIPAEGGSIESFGLGLQVTEPVGNRFVYNNGAVDLLAVVAQRADPDHTPLDDQLTQHFGGPMGFVGDWWLKDPVGVPRAAGELFVRPVDLAKIGLLVLDGGVWEGERLLSEDYVAQMIGPSVWEGYGLLWWRNSAADGTTLVRADGYLGQFVAIVPDERLVVVRMRDPMEVPAVEGDDPYTWRGYVDDVLRLVGKTPKPR